MQSTLATPLVGARQVAEGGSAIVFRARVGEREVACKVARAPAFHAVVAAEARRLALLDHPSLPSLVLAGAWPEAGPLAGAPFLATPWLSGGPLPASPRSALLVARDVGGALAAMERAGLSHGDVKPDNLRLVTSRGGERVVLFDLGLAGGAAEHGIDGYSRRYLAPEAAAGEHERRYFDRYALGVVLGELLDPAAAASREPVAVLRASTDRAPVFRLVRALVSPHPHERPSPGHVAELARAELGEGPDEAESSALVRAAYVGVRRAELVRTAAAGELAVPGDVAAFARDCVAALRLAHALEPVPAAAHRMDPLDPPGRARWLAALVGPPAASWPVAALAALDEETLYRGLARAASLRPPSAWTFAWLSRVLAGDAVDPRATARWPDAGDVGLALALAAPVPEPRALATAEARALSGTAPAALTAALMAAWTRGGSPERALLLADGDAPEIALAGADAARRAGAPERACSLALHAEARTEDPAARARGRAIRARVALDAGDAAGAAELVADEVDAHGAEVLALARAAVGDLASALGAAERGLALARTDEERARLRGTVGYVLHARGEAGPSRRAYEDAAAAAERAGAVVEEASYRTGEAAAAIGDGDLAAGLFAADRAAALWTALRRPAMAARALLSRGSALRIAGAHVESARAAREALVAAELSGDLRARAFATLVLADAGADDGDVPALRAARARVASTDDALLVDARLHARGALDAPAVTDADVAARDAPAGSAGALDWWTARAEASVRGAAGPRAADLLATLFPRVAGAGPADARGRAAHVAAELAGRAGDGAAARRLRAIQRSLALTLVSRCPPELRDGVLAAPWVAAVGTGTEGQGPGAEKLGEVLSLVRALSGRERLAPLLGQVLDALVLWTGVERGVYLAPAPDGRLVPRVARNLSRDELRGEQLALSRTLSTRALTERRTVVAVDAAGESADTAASVHALSLRSVLAVPLLARGRALGVVYLDDRVRRGAFGPDELAWVELVAGIAAVAVADAYDQVFLRRAARKATRAEARLAASLAEREASDAGRAAPLRGKKGRHEAIVGTSEAIMRALDLVDRVAPTDVPVLLYGESGSGKELFARAVHAGSRRAHARFVAESCGAIPEPLLESILFGHARGAFTGAVSASPGLFVVADGGTLFLDEIGEMSLAMQTKLLRVLSTGEVRAVGGSAERKVSVRLVAATHRDLAAMVRERTFREDLYYRLRVVEVRVPPLRERSSDVPLLVHHFLGKHARDGRVRVTPQAMDALSAFAWPGNVRQLENEVRRAVVLSDGVIDEAHLSPEVTGRARGGGAPSDDAARTAAGSFRDRVSLLEGQLIRDALARSRGNVSRAATDLGLSRFGLQKMMKRLKITARDPLCRGRRVSGGPGDHGARARRSPRGVRGRHAVRATRPVDGPLGAALGSPPRCLP